ncbi:hypothetical protein [Sphingomonas sp.]|uniref:hypothetical protein n=1 Tax=Sphingomonas sp. TaxID=28214 RepID=UPI0025FEC391|nr:hypothetical protein [Sphingomonas sp.]
MPIAASSPPVPAATAATCFAVGFTAAVGFASGAARVFTGVRDFDSARRRVGTLAFTVFADAILAIFGAARGVMVKSAAVTGGGTVALAFGAAFGFSGDFAAAVFTGRLRDGARFVGTFALGFSGGVVGIGFSRRATSMVSPASRRMRKFRYDTQIVRNEALFFILVAGIVIVTVGLFKFLSTFDFVDDFDELILVGHQLGNRSGLVLDRKKEAVL